MLAHPGLAAYYNRGFPRTTASARIVEDFDATLVARGLAPVAAARLAIATANHAIATAAFRQLDDGTEPAHLDPVAFPILTEVRSLDPREEDWFDWGLRATVRGMVAQTLDGPC
jgi:hypothetical protein